MIEPATVHHAAAMAAIHAVAFPDDPWSEAGFSNLLNQPGVAGFIDERGGLVLTRVAADEAEILTIGVTAPRQGIGKTLMRAAIAHLKTLNVTKLYLEAATSNEPARALYQSLGFEQVGLRRKYYPDGSDALALSLSIPVARSDG